MYLVCDFETRSEGELTEIGLHNYAINPTTKALMLGWRIVQTLEDKKTPVEIWEPRTQRMPERLLDAINDPTVVIIAFNSAFERYIFQYVLGLEIPASRFQDPQASARYLSLPASLEDVGMVLGLPMSLRKDDRGKELMKMFSFPKTRKKKDGGGIYFNEPEDFPKEWEDIKSIADRTAGPNKEVARREMLLDVFPLPDRERAIWLFDQSRRPGRTH